MRPTPALPAVLALLLVGTSCSMPSAMPFGLGHRLSPPAPPLVPVYDFSGEQACVYRDALATMTPRPTGSDASARTRAYIETELEKLGLEVRALEFEVPKAKPAKSADPEAAGSAEPGEDASKPAGEPETMTITHLVTEIPGHSDDLILLGAKYDTTEASHPGETPADPTSGDAGLLLEFARSLVARPLPYTVWLLFLDGEGPEVFYRKTRMPGLGSLYLAKQLAEDGTLERVRVGVFYQEVDRPNVVILRDLYSHRVYREAFWTAARQLGDTDAFPEEADFDSPHASHRAFFRTGLRRVVVISGHVDADEGGQAEVAPVPCSPTSLAIVGRVSLAALGDLSALLRKVDRLAPPPPRATPKAAATTAASTEEESMGAAEVEPPSAASSPESEESVQVEEEGFEAPSMPPDLPVEPEMVDVPTPPSPGDLSE